MVIVSPVKEVRFGIPLTTFTVAYRSMEFGNNSLKITSRQVKSGIQINQVRVFYSKNKDELGLFAWLCTAWEPKTMKGGHPFAYRLVMKGPDFLNY